MEATRASPLLRQQTEKSIETYVSVWLLGKEAVMKPEVGSNSRSLSVSLLLETFYFSVTTFVVVTDNSAGSQLTLNMR